MKKGNTAIILSIVSVLILASVFYYFYSTDSFRLSFDDGIIRSEYNSCDLNNPEQTGINCDLLFNTYYRKNVNRWRNNIDYWMILNFDYNEKGKLYIESSSETKEIDIKRYCISEDNKFEVHLIGVNIFCNTGLDYNDKDLVYINSIILHNRYVYDIRYEITSSEPLIEPDCTLGETNCEGTNYFTCLDEAWKSEGTIDGKCGYTEPVIECTSSQTKCIGTNYYTCSSSNWLNNGEVDGKCGYVAPVCSSLQTKCEGTTFYTCSNGQWLNNGQVEGECNYVIAECSAGQSDCSGLNYYTCLNGNWNYQGKVLGECGVDCTSDSNCGINERCSIYECETYCVAQNLEDTKRCSTSGDVIIDYQRNDCSTSTLLYQACVSSQECISGECINTAECNTGETNCDGNIYIECVDEKWVNYGVTEGKCGVICLASATQCEGYGISICEDYSYSIATIEVGQCGVECIDNSYCSSTEACQDYVCVDVSECLLGEDACFGFDYYLCDNTGHWEKQGKISEKCGISCINDLGCGTAYHCDSETYSCLENAVINDTEPDTDKPIITIPDEIAGIPFIWLMMALLIIIILLIVIIILVL